MTNAEYFHYTLTLNLNTMQPTRKVQQTALMKFMEYLRENHYYISSEMVDKYWELLAWEENVEETSNQQNSNEY